MWLAEVPQPRPPRESWAANPVFRYIQAGCERHHAAHPEFMGVHYMAADQVEECWQLLRQSMRSISWECLAHLPSYSAWLSTQDWTGRLPAAPAQPAAHRPAGRRETVGAEEPQPPVRARRAARRSTRTPWSSRRTGTRAPRSPRSAAWPRRPRPAGRTSSPATSSARTSWSCGPRGSSGSAPNEPGPNEPGPARPGSSTSATRTWWPTRWARPRRSTRIRAPVHRCRGDEHAGPGDRTSYRESRYRRPGAPVRARRLRPDRSGRQRAFFWPDGGAAIITR